MSIQFIATLFSSSFFLFFFSLLFFFFISLLHVLLILQLGLHNSTMSSHNTIIVVACLNKPIFGNSIKYFVSQTHDIYLIGRAPLFLGYLNRILQSNNDQEITVLLIHDGVDILIDVLLTLHKASSEQNLQSLTSRFRENYNKHMDKVPRSGPPIEPPHGHNDVPIGYKVAIVQLCDGLDRLDHLTAQNVATQQLLRLFALIHGASYTAVSGVGKICKDTSLLGNFAAEVTTAGLDLQVYDAAGASWGHGVHIHQHIPSGWDSWSRIEMAARAIPEANLRSGTGSNLGNLDADSVSGVHMLDSGAILSVYSAYKEYTENEANKAQLMVEVEYHVTKEVQTPPNSGFRPSYAHIVATLK